MDNDITKYISAVIFLSGIMSFGSVSILWILQYAFDYSISWKYLICGVLIGLISSIISLVLVTGEADMKKPNDKGRYGNG